MPRSGPCPWATAPPSWGRCRQLLSTMSPLGERAKRLGAVSCSPLRIAPRLQSTLGCSWTVIASTRLRRERSNTSWRHERPPLLPPPASLLIALRRRLPWAPSPPSSSPSARGSSLRASRPGSSTTLRRTFRHVLTTAVMTRHRSSVKPPRLASGPSRRCRYVGSLPVEDRVVAVHPHRAGPMQRYHEAFWIRGPKTFTTGVKHNWQKLQARVERGEAVLKESAQACAALAVHIARSIPSYAAPPHLLQPGASRASLAALPAPPADVLSSMLQSGVPFATNPWRYIPLSYSTANPWGHSAAVSAPPPPKYMTVGLAKGARSVGDSIVSPFSSLAPVALPSTAWSCPPLPASSRVPAQATLRTGAPAAPAAADAAPLTLTAILTPGLEAAAAHNPHRLLTEHAALSLSRAGYVASNDAFLLSAIARYGGVSVCSFDAIAEDIRRDPAHMLDTFFRSRSPAQLEARAKVLLKCVLRDVVDTQRRPDKALADEAKQAQKRLTITYARIADEMARAIVIQEMIGDTGSAMHLLPSGKGLEAIDSEEDGAPKATGPSSGKAANAEKPKPPAGSRKIVPDSLVGELLRTIAAAGRAGIDSVAVDFLESPAVQNYAEDLAVEAAAASSTALLDAEAIRANADKLKPSKAQVKHYIDVLAFKDNGPRAIPSGVWRVRPDYAAVARMSDSEVAAWISANPLPPPKPKAKKAGDDAKPDAEDTAGAVAVETTAAVTVESGAAAVEPAGAVAAAPAEATAVPDVEDALTTPEMKGGALVALASLVAAAGREGIEHIVAEFLAYPAEVCRAASKTKSAIRRDIKAIATRDKFWRLMPAYEYLLKEPMPPREEVASTIAAPSAVGEAASAAMEAATGDDAVAAPPPVVAGTVASGGSLLGLGGAAKPRISL